MTNELTRITYESADWIGPLYDERDRLRDKLKEAKAKLKVFAILFEVDELDPQDIRNLQIKLQETEFERNRLKYALEAANTQIERLEGELESVYNTEHWES
jgi:predicted  nucleic acid-binding Zn-ribbon protein